MNIMKSYFHIAMSICVLLVIVATTLYLAGFMYNKKTIECDSKEKLAELFGFDFSDVLITDVQSRDDAEDKGTLLCVCIYDAREIQSVGYYFNERVSDVVDPELAKIPPGDIEELLDMGIKRANIEQYGFNFREIRVGYSDYPYLIYWFRIDNSYDGQSNFILLTWIPRKVSVRVERIVSDEFAG